MAFPVAAAIGAGASLLGNLFSGSSNARQSERNYKHRYQWEVQDLKKAGLNPSLAYGHNAPIPPVQPLEPLGDSAVKGAQAASSARQTQLQADLIKEQTNLLRAQSADLVEGIKIKNALMFSQTQQAGASAGLTMKQQEALELTMDSLKLDNEYKKATLSDRIAMIQAELKKKGIEMDYLQIQKALGELTKPRLQSEAQFFNTLGGAGTNNALQLLRLLGTLVGGGR